MNFLKTEILFVDFVLDYQAADLHILITEVDNGGGGDQYQLIFYGQKNYKAKTDTLRFATSPHEIHFYLPEFFCLVTMFCTGQESRKTETICGLQ